jgi:hypothetical protein
MLSVIYAKCHMQALYSECIKLHVVVLNVVMLNVVILNVVMLNVIMLTVVAPCNISSEDI